MTFVDSNVWIFLNIEEAPEHDDAREKIEKLCARGLRVNDIIISEVFHKLSILLSPDESLRRVNRMLDSGFVSYEILRMETVRRALSLAADHNMRINDAIIAAHALECRASLLTDNWRDFTKIKTLHVLRLRP